MSARAFRVQLDLTPPPIVRKISQRSLIFGVVFAIAVAVGVLVSHNGLDEFYQGYLLGYMCWLGVALGSMAILMIRHMTGGGWGTVIRRVLGAAMRTMPLLTILFIPLAVAAAQGHMYPWAMPFESIKDEHIREHLINQRFITQSYLNVTGFIIRAIIYFAIWNVLSILLSKWSKEADSPEGRDNGHRFRMLSAPGLILYAFSITFATIDWAMSLDPTWISTIYGLILLIGELLSAMCFAVVVERILVDYRPMSELLRSDFVLDHGKWMLTFIMLWAYFSFSQWLIIWAGNLPGEISFYLRRIHNGWGYIGLALAAFHFAVPFAMLLSRPFKQNIRKLVWLAIWLMLMCYLDLFWIISASFSVSLSINWAEIVVPIAIGGFWLWAYFRNLASLPLLPAYDPQSAEVLHPSHYIHV